MKSAIIKKLSAISGKKSPEAAGSPEGSSKGSPEDRVARRLSLHMAMAVREIYDAIAMEKNRPVSMTPFDTLFKNFADAPEKILPTGPRKKIGIYCMAVPEELIYAAGALPVRLCAGSGDAAEAGEALFPDVSCPMVKAATGFTRTGVLPMYRECDLIIIPTTCDWKVKLGELISRHVPVMMLSVPKFKAAESSRRFWYAEIRRLMHALEKVTGKRITRKKLRAAMDMMHKAQQEFRRLQTLRMDDLSLIRGRDAAAVANAWFYMDGADWTLAARNLNEELLERKEKGIGTAPRTAPRILLTGSPVIFPNWKIPDLIENAGGTLTCDELCSSGRLLWDMACIDEPLFDDMLDALADRCLLPCTCPVFTDREDRKTRLFRMIKDYRVEGVVHHVLKGCHPYDMELRPLEAELAAAGVSQLKIETDYSPEDTEPLRTRVEAFVETLKGRRLRMGKSA
ncbi:benzoyl-CoA reductase/2-hydroxyglutaryl-CoA dehydratase subunit BcrC/BadD/HgdB [Desulfobotulus alkaliphilus]|uniref:Benzoyl-CoA reductase/2-hydroxyglutaryl-CoA dehydratase subunit BcrC/BadD/HgdB n=1 Tax=Desulfobotulus alkaliphilus TaxID=622671 RepID=A0A562S0T3_9BACT|nr:2-hydroxyacyl-CoA dehydratase family protein [Desulfobotulus alkaliphilus]TWI74180.1 benzoyl-CoA reductase/2-hydroxyglutaryl-CoA dehydratase subunit BcrC/BadD/HgdB [Desulfobotulus alkaliphilus]